MIRKEILTEWNFNLKLRKLQTKLDMWRARDLTLFGRVMILKSLGLSKLIYSSSILNIPEGFANLVKAKLFKFLWKNKRDKIKSRGFGLYAGPGQRWILLMTDIEITFIKALKLAWIPGLLSPGRQNWRTVPDYYLHRLGGPAKFLIKV